MIWINIVGFVLSLAGIGSWAYWAYNNKSISLYAVAPLGWLLNAAVFYGYSLRSGAQPGLIHEWGVVLQLQALITLIYASYIMLRSVEDG